MSYEDKTLADLVREYESDRDSPLVKTGVVCLATSRFLKARRT